MPETTRTEKAATAAGDLLQLVCDVVLVAIGPARNILVPLALMLVFGGQHATVGMFFSLLLVEAVFLLHPCDPVSIVARQPYGDPDADADAVAEAIVSDVGACVAGLVLWFLVLAACAETGLAGGAEDRGGPGFCAWVAILALVRASVFLARGALPELPVPGASAATAADADAEKAAMTQHRDPNFMCDRCKACFGAERRKAEGI